jgi:DNA repair protein RecO (recombination protein O)
LHTQALVLRSVDFSESDRILHLLVPEIGRVTVMAKHARKSMRRFGGTLDLFNHLAVEIERKRPGLMSRIDKARLVHSFTPLRSDPRRFALACYLLEMLDRLAPEGGREDDMRRLFGFALDGLGWLARGEPDLRVQVLLEIRTLDALGLRPELRRCVRCGREAAGGRGPGPGDGRVDFHVPEGGPLCGACAQRATGLLRVHAGTLRALEQGLSWELDQLDRLAFPARALSEACGLVARFQRFHLGIELSSERFLRQMLGAPEAAPPAPAADRVGTTP